MRIGVPVKRYLLDIEHGEGLLLLLLIIDVDEDPIKPVASHLVVYAVTEDAEVEGLVVATHQTVLKSDVHVGYSESQVLPDDLLDALHVALVLLLDNACLAPRLELLLL
jgi:hypothetical protein